MAGRIVRSPLVGDDLFDIWAFIAADNPVAAGRQLDWIGDVLRHLPPSPILTGIKLYFHSPMNDQIHPLKSIYVIRINNIFSRRHSKFQDVLNFLAGHSGIKQNITTVSGEESDLLNRIIVPDIILSFHILRRLQVGISEQDPVENEDVFRLASQNARRQGHIAEH